MPNTTSYKFGDIVLVSFPFTNQRQRKQRPAIIISSSSYHQSKPDIIIMAITSQVRSSLAVGEVLLQEWQSAGLLKPSVIKPVITTLERSLVIKKLGTLHSKDLQPLKKSLKTILG